MNVSKFPYLWLQVSDDISHEKIEVPDKFIYIRCEKVTSIYLSNVTFHHYSSRLLHRLIQFKLGRRQLELFVNQFLEEVN